MILIVKIYLFFFFINMYMNYDEYPLKKEYKRAYHYGNGMFVGLKQPPKKTNPDGTKQGYYYGNGFYGHDEGDKGEANKKKKTNPLWMSILMILCINY